MDGRRAIVYKQGKADNLGTDSELDALVKRIDEYCKEAGITKLPDICLPPLAEIIPIPKYERSKDTNN